MSLTDRQPGVVAVAIVPSILSTLVVILRALRKVKSRPSHVNRVGVFTAETLLVASVVSLREGPLHLVGVFA